jgi:hypothetical protein
LTKNLLSGRDQNAMLIDRKVIRGRREIQPINPARVGAYHAREHKPLKIGHCVENHGLDREFLPPELYRKRGLNLAGFRFNLARAARSNRGPGFAEILPFFDLNANRLRICDNDRREGLNLC